MGTVFFRKIVDVLQYFHPVFEVCGSDAAFRRSQITTGRVLWTFGWGQVCGPAFVWRRRFQCLWLWWNRIGHGVTLGSYGHVVIVWCCWWYAGCFCFSIQSGHGLFGILIFVVEFLVWVSVDHLLGQVRPWCGIGDLKVMWPHWAHMRLAYAVCPLAGPSTCIRIVCPQFLRLSLIHVPNHCLLLLLHDYDTQSGQWTVAIGGCGWSCQCLRCAAAACPFGESRYQCCDSVRFVTWCVFGQ